MANQYTANIEITDSYIKYIKENIIIYKEDLCKYYLIDNHSRKDTAEYFKVSEGQIGRCIARFNLKKSPQQAAIINKQHKLERYGDANYNNLEKAKQTCLAKYGVDNFFKNVKLLEQARLKKIGVAYAAQSPEILKKIKDTTNARYSMDELNDKRRKTCLEKYGVEYPMQIPRVQQHFKNANYMREKMWNTKLKNHTTNTSHTEKAFEKWLHDNLLDSSDYIHEYKSEKYPFHADFYIISLDLYIELNLYWTHGGHLYNPEDELDQITLKEWQSKDFEKNPQYEQAIKVWTERDVKKIKWANDHNLNYLVAYNSEDIERIKTEILNKLKKEIINDNECN